MGQRECQGLLGDAGDKRTNQPSESGRNAAGKRDGFQLYVDAAILLIKTPVRIQPPQVAAIVAYRLLRSIRLVDTFYFRNACTAGIADGTRQIKGSVRRVVFRIQNYGHNLVLTKAQENLEVVTIMLQQLGALHIWRIIFVLVVVILEKCQRLLERGSLHESQTAPMVDQAARYRYRLAVFKRVESVRDHFSCTQPGVAGVTLVSGKTVNQQECSWHLCGHALFGELDVMIEGCNRGRFQLGSAHRSRQLEHQRGQKEITHIGPRLFAAKQTRRETRGQRSHDRNLRTKAPPVANLQL